VVCVWMDVCVKERNLCTRACVRAGPGVAPTLPAWAMVAGHHGEACEAHSPVMRACWAAARLASPYHENADGLKSSGGSTAELMPLPSPLALLHEGGEGSRLARALAGW
jgi:hypothetical protein